MKKLNNSTKTRFSNIGFILFMLAAILFSYSKVFAQQKDMMVRISEIEIYPEYLTVYNAILKEEAEASVRLEPGVLGIFPMYQKEDSTQVRILEMYDSKEAYLSHLKTPHFQKYKTLTLKMVKSLKLIDMNVIDSASMKLIFRKIKN